MEGLDKLVDNYNIVGPTILHQESVINLINEGLMISEEESTGYQRGCCGGMLEKTCSTIEVINRVDVPKLCIPCSINKNKPFMALVSKD